VEHLATEWPEAGPVRNTGTGLKTHPIDSKMQQHHQKVANDIMDKQIPLKLFRLIGDE